MLSTIANKKSMSRQNEENERHNSLFKPSIINHYHDNDNDFVDEKQTADFEKKMDLNNTMQMQIQKPLKMRTGHCNLTTHVHDGIDWYKVMEMQPTINLMTIGNVAHGKSTLMKALSNESTSRFHEEMKKNMTIVLGYTSFKIYQCLLCPRPFCYSSYPSTSKLSKEKKGNKKKRNEIKVICKNCGNDDEMSLVRHVSFIDSPGHNRKLGTMLTGTSYVDGTILLVDASKKCPENQTKIHLCAARLFGIASSSKSKNNLIVAQNKIDLTTKQRACESVNEIRSFVNSFGCEKTPIVPISAISKLNIDALCMAIVDMTSVIPSSLEDNRRNGDGFLMACIRSFDINKSSAEISKLHGGVAGGVIMYGKICVGDNVEIRPGLIKKSGKKSFKIYPIKSRVVSLFCGKNRLKVAFRGANIGVGLNVDPFLTIKNRMVGHLIGVSSSLPDVFIECKILVSRLPIAKIKKKKNESRFGVDEIIKIIVGSFETKGKIISHSHNETFACNEIHLKLFSACCAEISSRVAILRSTKYLNKENKSGHSYEENWCLTHGALIFKIKAMKLNDISSFSM